MSKDSKNLDNLSDAELICLYKDGNETAESILVYRYRGFSFMLAKTMYESYGAKFYIEIDDLASIALFALFNAMDNYDQRTPFYPYWKKVAQHQMTKHINDASSFYKNILISRDENFLSNESETVNAFSSCNALGRDGLYDQIIDYLYDPKGNITIEEANVFLLYIDGYSFSDITKLTGVKYHMVRKIVSTIQKKLKNHLRY